MATCQKLVETTGAAYPCDENEAHLGPCACIEKPVTKSRRKRWIADNAVEAVAETVNDGMPHAVFEGRAELDLPVTVGGADVGPFDKVETPKSEWSMRGDNPVYARPTFEGSASAPAPDVAAAPPVPTKQREGDQPLPVVNDQTDIQSLVIADINARRELGISRYGTALQPFNGRDVDQDLYEEMLDATMYARQRMIEREAAYHNLMDVLDRGNTDTRDFDAIVAAVDILFPGRRAA